MDQILVSLLQDRLLQPQEVIRRNFRVSRKGCGRGSGEAPRALKLVLLNRATQADPSDLIHEGGDLYTLGLAGSAISFTFRVTTSHRLTETGRPWFNPSAAEIQEWKALKRLLIVAECKQLKTAAPSYLVRCYLVDPELFADVAQYETKPSENTPTALFEVRNDAEGYFLFNLTAKDKYPAIRLTNSVVEIKLTKEESNLISEAYAIKHERDHTSGYEPLTITIDPGSAPPEEIADILADVSHLYRLLGGSGITFTMTDARFPALVHAK